MKKLQTGFMISRIRFLELKNELLEENHRRLNRVYGENARLYHDMNHHLQMIYCLAQKCGCTEIMDYVTSVSEPVRELPDITWSGVDIVDAILNHTLAQAQSLGIAMDLNAEFPKESSILADDICVILFNLLDNALENTKKYCTSDGCSAAPVISVAIRKIERFLIIKIKNPCGETPKKRFGRFFSTKKDPKHHGIGLGNVQKTAEKYGGNLETEVSGGMFTASVLLFL